MRALLIILAGLCAVSIRAASPEQNRLEVYNVSYADLGPATEAVTVLAGPEGHVTADEGGRRLIVITSPDRHEQIRDLLRQLDRAPRNVRIDVEFRRAGGGRESEVSVSGEGEVVHEDGMTHSKIRIKPRVVDETTTSRQNTRQTLLVASGREARLRVGESVPYADWLISYGHRGGVLAQSQIQWQDVGSYLVVQPTVVGEGPLIRLRLTPELSGLVEGHAQQTQFANVATEVVVQDGQSFQIGGLDQDQEFYSRFLIGGARSGSQDQLVIILTPRIEQGGGVSP